MKRLLSLAVLTGAALTAVSAQTLLFQDNFDVADTSDFDSAPLTGRLSGTAAGETSLQSAGTAQAISGNRLGMVTVGYPGVAGVRFGGQTSRYDWAGATTGPSILAAQGFEVTLDWTHNGTSGEWIAFKVGTANNDVFVNESSVDHGILLRGTGANERYDNGSGKGNSGISYSPAAGVVTTYPVKLTYNFSSFADGSAVNLIAMVNGVQVVNDNFTWSGNAGALYMDLQSFVTGYQIDNFSIKTIGQLDLDVTLTGTSLASGATLGAPIGTLTGILGVNPATSSFALVPGDGDDDNALFDIDGDQLVVNSDFTGNNSVNGQQFSVRIQGTSTEGGGETGEAVFVLTVRKDDDDDALLDAWEENWTGAGNLLVLTGDGVTDTDDDGLTDLDEFNLSKGMFSGRPAYPSINPIKQDTDGDGLLDGEEVFPSSSRPQTDPTNADMDFDGLSDKVETNSGIFVDAIDTGTNPTDPDWDNDGARDGWELTNLGGAAMFDNTAFPASASPSVTVKMLTDDASSEISTSKVYTHAISGGGSATVNGVVFDVLTDVSTPANFAWSTHDNVKAIIAPINNASWMPANGGVTGPGLLNLLGGITWSYTGGVPGDHQTYTLSGLTPGQNYMLRFYIRRWDAGGTGRLIDFTFTNGTEVVTPYGALPEDRPGFVLGTGNDDNAYFLSYSYTAQGTELVIDASNNARSGEPWGSFHMYGLTNEVAGAAAGQLLVTNVSRNPATGDMTLDFLGEPDTSYTVTKSPDIKTGFGPLASPLSPATNGSGVGQVTVPASEFGGAPKYFLRIEK